jgi:hypothetical protein
MKPIFIMIYDGRTFPRTPFEGYEVGIEQDAFLDIRGYCVFDDERVNTPEELRALLHKRVDDIIERIKEDDDPPGDGGEG